MVLVKKVRQVREQKIIYVDKDSDIKKDDYVVIKKLKVENE